MSDLGPLPRAIPTAEQLHKQYGWHVKTHLVGDHYTVTAYKMVERTAFNIEMEGFLTEDAALLEMAAQLEALSDAL